MALTISIPTLKSAGTPLVGFGKNVVSWEIHFQEQNAEPVFISSGVGPARSKTCVRPGVCFDIPLPQHLYSKTFQPELVRLLINMVYSDGSSRCHESAMLLVDDEYADHMKTSN